MEVTYITLSLFLLFLHLVSFSVHSKSIVKNLPGFHGDLPFTLETGYVGVGAEKEIQFFYYFVESQRDPFKDPLLLYFAGGPGTSGLFSLLEQIGPLSIIADSSETNVTLELNPYSLTKVANVIFIDQPAGVGFSYAKTWEGTSSSDSVLALQSHEFLKKWLLENPKFRNHDLYISGISYMGILVPVVALEAYKGNERGDQPQLNIQGYLIISPLTDKFIDFNSRFEFAHRLALISDDIYESTKEACDGNYVYNNPENILCSNRLQEVEKCTSRINLANILDPYCDAIDPDPACSEAADIYLDFYGNNKDVQKALRVREGTVEKFQKSNETIHYNLWKKDTICYSYDIFSSIIYHKNLTSRNCQVLILSGDHDMTFTYVGMEQWITSLNLPVEKPWHPWFVNNQVAGYRMKYAVNGYSLTYATVKGGGHSIPIYKPEEVLVILDGWLASNTYLSDS